MYGSEENISTKNQPKPLEFPTKVNPILESKTKGNLKFTSKNYKP